MMHYLMSYPVIATMEAAAQEAPASSGSTLLLAAVLFVIVGAVVWVSMRRPNKEDPSKDDGEPTHLVNQLKKAAHDAVTRPGKAPSKNRAPSQEFVSKWMVTQLAVVASGEGNEHPELGHYALRDLVKPHTYINIAGPRALKSADPSCRQTVCLASEADETGRNLGTGAETRMNLLLVFRGNDGETWVRPNPALADANIDVFAGSGAHRRPFANYYLDKEVKRIKIDDLVKNGDVIIVGMTVIKFEKNPYGKTILDPKLQSKPQPVDKDTWFEEV